MQLEFLKDPKIPVRIGIHTGDVVFSEDDIIGDGVNVASRVESPAKSGAVFISEKVYDEIKNQPKLQTQSMGYFELKNVEKPMEIYALANPGLTVPEREQIRVKTKIPAPEKTSPGEGDSTKIIKTGAVILGILLVGYFLYLFGPTINKILQRDINTELTGVEVRGKSIAVLPLKNLSEEEGSQYFSDGMMDAILNNLSKIGELKVISRTSMEQYRDSKNTIPEIAEELGVANILEGSVQRYGNKVRIIVQLINAREDQHIWSEIYDREITDVFVIQSEIAKQIAQELKAELSPQEQERIEKIPTHNLAAYDLYLKGNQYYNNFFHSREEKDLRLAINFYKKALELDPDFYLARINLGRTFISRVTFLGEEVNLYDSALSLANNLIGQYPDRSELLVLLGTIYRHKGFDKVRTKELLIKAVTSNPNDPRALSSLSRYLRREENRLDLALILIQRASAVDPFTAGYYVDEGFSWIYLDDLEKAEKAHLEALRIQPDHVLAHTNLGLVYILKEDHKKALSVLQQALSFNSGDLYLNHQIAFVYSFQEEFEKSEQYFLKVKKVVESEDFTQNRSDGWFPARYAYTMWNLGKKEEAKKYFEEQIKRDLQFIEENVENTDGDTYYELAGSHASLGNKDEAYYWLNNMLENNRWVPGDWFLQDPWFDNLKGGKRLNKHVEANNRGLEALRKNYEELKNLSFTEVIKRISEPLEISPPENL